MIEQIDARIRRALAQVRQAFRGVLTRCDGAPAVQLVQVDGLSGEQLQDAELMQQFGFTSNPPPGTMVVVLPVGGRTAHGIVIACEHGQYRLHGLIPGETAIYNQWGDYCILKAGHVAEIATGTLVIKASQKVRVESPVMECTGTVEDLCDLPDGRTMSAMRGTYNAHTHPGDSGGTTGAPNQEM
jgi:phage baseplate assembly protein V